MAIPIKFKYSYYNSSNINQLYYPSYNYIKYPYGFPDYSRLWFINNANNDGDSFPKEEYFEDIDITVINCCKDIVKELSPLVDNINCIIEITNKYISAILNGDYKMSIYDFYNEEIKKGLLTYITNVFRNYPTFSNKELNKKMIGMFLKFIRNGYFPNIKVNEFDNYIELANENDSAQEIAELLEFRHRHYGNSVDVSRFDL